MLHKRFFQLSFIALMLTISVAAQNTVGLLSYDPAKTQPGYNLFYTFRQGTVFLMNNCGEIVHTWHDTLYGPGHAVYLQEDGSIFIAKSREIGGNPWINAGGAGEKIEHRTWNDSLIWEYEYNDSLRRMHHDFKVMPNGNVLFIAWEVKDSAECIASGRDTAKLSVNRLLPDHLIEVKPLGKDSGEIVWEWHAWDHLIQDYDPTKNNYGDVSKHPELIDINYMHPQSTDDWLHANAVDFNPTLNMIIISIPTFNEVWIIDHSTTTLEAKGHTGGQSGKGGDLLYRWGNPETYRKGNSADRKLGYQHTPTWFNKNLNMGDLGFHQIILFNNQVTPTSSEASIFEPSFNAQTWSFDTLPNGQFAPMNFSWTYNTPNPAQMNSAVVSNAQRLPNGNTLICACRKGYVFEIDANNNIVWEYIVPFKLGLPVAQGSGPIPLGNNLTFRIERYADDFAGLQGKDLSAKGYIELNPDTTFCSKILTYIPYQSKNENSIRVSTYDASIYNIESNITLLKFAIMDVAGNIVFEQTPNTNQTSINLSEQAKGIYFYRAVLKDGEVLGGKIMR